MPNTNSLGYPIYEQPNSEMDAAGVKGYNDSLKANYHSKKGTIPAGTWTNPDNPNQVLPAFKREPGGPAYVTVPKVNPDKWHHEQIFQIGQGGGLRDATDLEADQLPEVMAHEQDLIKNQGPIANELQKAGGVGNLNAGQIQKYWSLQQQRQWNIAHPGDSDQVRATLQDLHPTLTKMEEIIKNPNFRMGDLGFWGQHMSELSTMTDADLRTLADKNHITGDVDKARALWMQFKTLADHAGDLGARIPGLKSDSDLGNKVSDALGNLPFTFISKSPATAAAGTAAQVGIKGFAALLANYQQGKISAPELLASLPSVNNQITQEAIRHVNDNTEINGAAYPWTVLQTVNQAGDWMSHRPRNDDPNKTGIGFNEPGITLGTNLLGERAKVEATPTPSATPSATATPTVKDEIQREKKAATVEGAKKVGGNILDTVIHWADQDIQPSKDQAPAETAATPKVGATPKLTPTPVQTRNPAPAPTGPDAYARSRMSADELKLYDSTRDPSNVNNPQVANPEVSAAVQKYKALVNDYNNQQASQVTGQDLSGLKRAPIKVAPTPQQQSPVLNPLGPQQIITPKILPTAQNDQLPENAEVGNYVSQVPTLSAQEHVDALEPGRPFKWHQDGQTYVRV
jgi:hypothetical protein